MKTGNLKNKLTPEILKLFNGTMNEDLFSKKVKSSGAGKLVLYTLGVATVGTAGTVSYAYLDPKFRTQVEDKVPYTREAFDKVFGPPAEHHIPLPDTTKLTELKHKVTDKVSEIIPKRKEPGHTEVIKKKEVEKEIETSPIVQRTDDLAKEKDAKLKQEIESEENENRRLNKALDERITYALAGAEDKLLRAVDSKNSVITAIGQHTKFLRQAVDEPKDPHWSTVTEAYKDLEYAQKTDKPREADAENYMESLRKIINDARASKATADNPLLNGASEALNKFSFQLEESKAKVGQALRESKIMAEYKSLVEQSRNHFANELKSILPNVDIHAKENRMTVDELNSLIAHAHLRVDELRRQLTEQQLRQEQNIDKAVEQLKAEHRRSIEEQLERENRLLTADLRIDTERKLLAQKQQSEEELRAQLRRSAAAHSEHLEEVLHVQSERLKVYHNKLKDESIQKERQQFHKEISSSMGRLQGIESALEGRAVQDSENRRAKELWLACQNLVESVVHGRKGGADLETRRKPLANELMGIKEASQNDPFVNTMVTSFDDEALSVGVYTEQDLKSRFDKVRKLCRRTAMIGEHGGRLWQYFLSATQSMFMFDFWKEYPIDENVDPSSLDTFGILSRANCCIEERGDYEEAIRLMLLLAGEPGRIAQDWIKDAILHMETRQTAQLLLAHAAAISLRTIY